MATHKILVRVMNDPKNKQTLKKFRIEEFPEMDVQSTTRKLVEMYGEHLGFKEVEMAEIGYIAIQTNDDLQRAFEKGELHKNKIPVFYICRKQEESPSKRPAQDVKHGKYYSITAFCRYFQFFLSFCNINFLNVFLRKCNSSASVPRRQRYRFGWFLEKQEATKAVEGKITAGKNNQTAMCHPRR